MFTRILYATDGSDHARRALDYVRELARQYHAEVFVVHAYQGVPEVIGQPTYDRLLNSRMEAGSQIMDEAAGALEADGIAVRRELLEGPLAEAILSVADTRECDLIVLGARGLSSLQSLLLGSVSQHVIQHAQSPVLVVR
jgi:nucleotide-binding universal stress UspA family protein